MGDGVGESVGIGEEPCKKRGAASAMIADAVSDGRAAFEPLWVSRRLSLLRGWSDGNQEDSEELLA